MYICMCFEYMIGPSKMMLIMIYDMYHMYLPPSVPPHIYVYRCTYKYKYKYKYEYCMYCIVHVHRQTCAIVLFSLKKDPRNTYVHTHTPLLFPSSFPFHFIPFSLFSSSRNKERKKKIKAPPPGAVPKGNFHFYFFRLSIISQD